jgi:hypothetical protein
MKEKCTKFNIECGYAPSCYFIRPERCVESMTKAGLNREWKEKYNYPLEQATKEDIENFVRETQSDNKREKN